VLLTGIPKLSFKDDRAFAVVDPLGESPRLYASASELGFYYNDTRFLCTWEMTLNGLAPVSLSREIRFSGNTVVLSMSNPDLPTLGGKGRIRRDTFLIRRVMSFFEDTLFETVEIKNFSDQDHSLQIELWAGSVFEDVFEVRGYSRQKRGRMLPAEDSVTDGSRVTSLSYEGLDARIRRTVIHRLFEVEKIRLSPTLVGHFTRISVPGKQTVTLKSVVSFDRVSDCKLHGRDFQTMTLPEKMALLSRGYLINPLVPLTIHSDHAILNRSIELARRDIFTLLTQEEPNVFYPYAGIPWFSAPFGRDGMITAYQLLPWYPKLAKGVLDYAFASLGAKDDPFTDEQPGKVFHEKRRGEMSNTREVPFIPYYGSVDSTPLCLILLHEYVRWTMDLESLRAWWPYAMRALEWLENTSRDDPYGFIGYQKRSPTGLDNQGWKDSSDSIMHQNGQLATTPIRLCEVQGYVFRARMSMSGLARLLGYHDLAARLRMDAVSFRVRFQEKFWDYEREFIYLALDGKDRPCAVKSSNMGHCLWSEILTQAQAGSVANHLLSESMFSGYGVRTLADTEVAYNPLSYHNGSVWPHDVSLIMEGMRVYGHTSELEKLALGMMGVLESSDDFRLPELFCGFRRRENAPPVPYQVACKPQAWAAGSLYLMLKAMTGLSMDLDQNYVVFNSPLLTPKVNTLEIKGLQCRDWEIDLVLRRSRVGTTVDITRKVGNIRVLTVK